MVPIPVQPSKLKADIILCTHDHIDHCDEQTLKHTDFFKTRYAGPDSCARHFAKMGIEESRITALNRNDSISLGDAQIHAVYAKHTGDSIGVIVRHEHASVYFTGDSEYDERLLEAKIMKPDILVICINGKLGNMDFRQAADVAKGLAVKTAVPCHYAMFAENTEDPQNFRRVLEGSGVAFFELAFDRRYNVHTIGK
jgi:L-ascorbate 6-phosphate lactonase